MWLACVLPVAGLISAFWVLPFAWQRAYVNDMGWGKLPYASADNGFRSLSGALFTFGGETYWKYLIPRPDVDALNDMRWVLALAAMGLVLSIAFRVRAGVVLAGCALVMAVAFVVLPEGRLWNARLLPFYYLCLYLLAAVGVAEVGRTLAVLAARDPERPSIVVPVITVVSAMLLAFVAVGMPLRSLPFGQLRADGSYTWMGLTNGINQGSFVRSWARWNYTGYEGKDAYAEYRDLMLTMEEVGEEHGCGRAFWEYEKEINRYGTPMALMLLPHWSDGCIGSMEGLFFEASATTPVPLPDPGRAQRVAERRATGAALRHVRHRQGREPPAADGRPLLHRDLRPGDDGGARPPGPDGARHIGALGDLRGGRLRAGGAARERAGRARRRERCPARLDLPHQGRRREVRRSRRRVVPGPHAPAT